MKNSGEPSTLRPARPRAGQRAAAGGLERRLDVRLLEVREDPLAQGEQQMLRSQKHLGSHFKFEAIPTPKFRKFDFKFDSKFKLSNFQNYRPRVRALIAFRLRIRISVQFNNFERLNGFDRFEFSLPSRQNLKKRMTSQSHTITRAHGELI